MLSQPGSHCHEVTWSWPLQATTTYPRNICGCSNPQTPSESDLYIHYIYWSTNLLILCYRHYSMQTSFSLFLFSSLIFLHHMISELLTRAVGFGGGAGDLCLTNDSFIMTLFATSAGLLFIALYFKLKQRQQSSIMASPDLYQRRWLASYAHTHAHMARQREHQGWVLTAIVLRSKTFILIKVAKK